MSMNQSLLRSSPEAEGVPSEALFRLIQGCSEIDAMNSIMVLRHGRVIAEGWWKPYAAELKHELFSLSKSFVSVAAGIAESEGKLLLNDPVVKYFPDCLPTEPSENLKRMKIKHLLSMSCGHRDDAIGRMEADPDGNYPRGFLSIPVEFEPGTHFVYNSGSTYMVAAIIRRVTGLNVIDYLKPRLFEPLGINAERWDCDPMGTNLGGWGFWLRTEDIAKFSQLLLNGGSWNGRRLIPADYLRKATSAQSDNSMNENPDWKLGYGYQFWLCRHHAFRGDGAFGQYALVMPDQDIAIAITSGLPDMQRILNLIWEILLPVLSPKALPENPADHRKLLELLDSLEIPLEQGKSALRTGSFSYEMKENPVGIREIVFDLSKDECHVRFKMSSGSVFELPAGYGAWKDGQLPFDRPEMRRIASSAAWTDESLLRIRSCYYETPFRKTLEFRFDGNCLNVRRCSHLLFREEEWPEMTGTLRNG